MRTKTTTNTFIALHIHIHETSRRLRSPTTGTTHSPRDQNPQRSYERRFFPHLVISNAPLQPPESFFFKDAIWQPSRNRIGTCLLVSGPRRINPVSRTPLVAAPAVTRRQRVRLFLIPHLAFRDNPTPQSAQFRYIITRIAPCSGSRPPLFRSSPMSFLFHLFTLQLLSDQESSGSSKATV